VIRWATDTRPRWTRVPRRVAAALPGLVVLLLAQHTRGAPSVEQATADALFDEAKALLRKKQIPEACRKLEESQRLDPRDGTLLNLAVCHEMEGRLGTAWVEFQEALAAARQAQRWDRINLATQRLKSLEKQVPHLTVVVSRESVAPGFELVRDGVALAEPAWGTPVPVDPGEHTLQATAPDRLPWSTTLTIAIGEDVTVTMPVLKAVPVKPKPVSSPTPPPSVAPVQPPSSSWRRTGAYVAGGVGIIGLGIGSWFGLRAISKANESDDRCNGVLCDQKGLDLQDEAQAAARISNVGFLVGIAGIGLGTYLLLTPDGTASSTSLQSAHAIRVTPVASDRAAAILVRGSW